LEEEHGIDPKPALVIGLGHGGSLVWQIACYAPNFGHILAPVGGAFWRKIPTNCKSGANLVHTHQRTSAFWPLKGVKGTKKRYARTSIYRNLEMLLGKNECDPENTTVQTEETGVSLTTWADCVDGAPVELMMLDEKFAFQTWWLEDMLGRIERMDIDRTYEKPEEIEPGFRTSGTGTGFKTSSTGTGFKTSGTETGFKAAGSGTGFKAPGEGTGFRTSDTGVGSRFKRLN
jgi:poly(3-hydroxybutyrate) depolymerase